MMSNLDLVRMRQTADMALPSHAILYRATQTPDSHGGSTTSYTRVWAGPCRLAPLSTVEQSSVAIAERIGSSRGFWLTVDQSVMPVIDDRFVVDGVTYDVTGYDTGRSWPVSRRILLREVE